MNNDEEKAVEFERFYIRYTVVKSENYCVALDAKVWPSDRPKGADWPEEPLFTLRCKWDGCSHLEMKYLHFYGLTEFDAFTRCVKFIYEDLCEQNNVADGPV